MHASAWCPRGIDESKGPQHSFEWKHELNPTRLLGLGQERTHSVAILEASSAPTLQLQIGINYLGQVFS